MEKFCDFCRRVPLQNANQARHFVEHQLELSAGTPDLTDEARKTVQDYNEDDCRATENVRNWLETIRAGMITNGADLPRPVVKDTTSSENASAHKLRVAAVFDALTWDPPFRAGGSNYRAGCEMASRSRASIGIGARRKSTGGSSFA